MAAPATSNPCELLACHIAVIRALEYVGHKILVINSRSIRGQLRGVPAYLIYTVVPVDDVDRVTSPGMWSPLVAGMPDRRDALIPLLDDYVGDLIRARIPHEIGYLTSALLREAISA